MVSAITGAARQHMRAVKAIEAEAWRPSPLGLVAPLIVAAWTALQDDWQHSIASSIFQAFTPGVNSWRSHKNCAPSRDHTGFWAWRRAHSSQRDGASACSDGVGTIRRP